jgi:hypothetical protein
MPAASRTLKARTNGKSTRIGGHGSQAPKAVAEWAKQFDTKLTKLTERQDAFLKSLERQD